MMKSKITLRFTSFMFIQ